MSFKNLNACSNFSSKTFFKVSISEISIISSAKLTSIMSEIAEIKTVLSTMGS